MKFLNKIISALSVVALVASTAIVPVMAAPAAGTGMTMTATATPAADKSYVDIKVGYTSGEAMATTSQVKIVLDEELFSLTNNSNSYGWGDYMNEDEEQLYDTFWHCVKKGDGPAGFSTDMSVTQAKKAGECSINTVGTNKYVLFTFYQPSASLTDKNTLPAAMDNLFTFRLDVKDGADSKIWTEGYTFEFGDCSQGNTNTSDNSTMVKASIVADAGEPDAPVGPTIEETEVANDSNGRFAKGFGAKFTDVEAGGTVNVKWTLTNTETEATDSKTIAYDTTGISGNVAVGLVINMADTNVFENITAAAEIVE